MCLFFKNKLDKITKNELKRAKKEKIRCQKMYSDWKDDEYNCGPLKFIWGIKSADDFTSNGANFYTMNDINISYNRDTHKYLLDLETIYQFNNVKEKKIYLENLLDEFREYLYRENFFEVNFDPHLLYLYNNGEMFVADSLTELYYKFRIFVEGFKNL